MTGIKRLAILLTLAASPAAASSFTTNPQTWEELDLPANVASNWRVTALSVVRVGEGLRNPTFWGGGTIVDRMFGGLTISVGDLEVVVRSPVSGTRLDVNVPLTAISYHWKIDGFVVSDRNRFEDLIGVPNDPSRYRNSLTVEYPLTGLGALSSIFANEEVFYDLAARQWERSRAQIGVGLAVGPNAEVRIYYLRQDDRFALPHAINALGVTLILDLN